MSEHEQDNSTYRGAKLMVIALKFIDYLTIYSIELTESH